MTAPSRPDPWLTRYLQLTGAIGPDGLTRRLRPRACPHCGRTTLAGLDSDVAAFTVYLHPAPLNAAGEAAALILGWRTYALVRRVNGLQADHRDAAAIRRRPTTICDVLTTHHCGMRLPAHLYKPRPAPLPDNDHPPF